MFLNILKLTYKLYLSTIRVRIHGEKHPNAIYLFWHNKLFVLPKALKGIKGAVLVSPSRDGRIASYIVRDFGFDIIESSYRKRRLKGALEIVKRYRMGESVGITPDGPLGPKYRIKQELYNLLRKLECNVVLVGVRYSRFVALNSWDEFQIPFPFTKADVILERFHINDFASKEDLERKLVEINV